MHKKEILFNICFNEVNQFFLNITCSIKYFCKYVTHNMKFNNKIHLAFDFCHRKYLEGEAVMDEPY